MPNYFGKVCLKHPDQLGERNHGNCVACDKERLRNLYLSNQAKANARVKAWKQANPEAMQAQRKAYYVANTDKIAAKSRKWYAANKPAALATRKAWRDTNPEKKKAGNLAWCAANPEKKPAALARYRATKFKATPAWADKTKIEEFYFTANMLGMHTGEWHHVDHAVPLNSRLVCGLHCEANLQILPGSENCIKGNRHWPDMPSAV